MAELQALSSAQLATALAAEGVIANPNVPQSIDALLHHRRQQRVITQSTPTVDPALDASFWKGRSASVPELNEKGKVGQRPLLPYDVWLTRAGLERGGE